MKKHQTTKLFVKTNDLKKIKSTLTALLARDIKANPALYQDSTIEEDVLETIRFIDQLDR